jgi:hypothetical protein
LKRTLSQDNHIFCRTGRQRSARSLRFTYHKTKAQIQKEVNTIPLAQGMISEGQAGQGSAVKNVVKDIPLSAFSLHFKCSPTAGTSGKDVTALMTMTAIGQSAGLVASPARTGEPTLSAVLPWLAFIQDAPWTLWFPNRLGLRPAIPLAVTDARTLIVTARGGLPSTSPNL